MTVAEPDQPCTDPTWREADRLAALERYGILDTGREAAFDEVAALAADLLEAPIALVNIIAADRQWFKAEVGVGARETPPLDQAICRHALLQPGVTVLPDLRDDRRFDGNPLVHGELGLRFYAGALLETPEGLPLGTVCVLDREPRPEGISERQRRALATLASQVMAQIELRRAEAVARAERERAERRSRRLSLLAEASALLLSVQEPAASVRALFALIRDGFPIDLGFHYRCQGNGLDLVAAAGLTPEQECAAAWLELGQLVCGIVAQRREPMHVIDIQASDEELHRPLKALGLHSYFSAPLLADGALLGTLSFGRKDGPFSPGEIEALQTLVAQLATALGRGQAEAALREREERQAFLLRFGDALRAEPDADAVANRAIAMLREQMRLDRCYVASFRMDEDRADITHQMGGDRVAPMPPAIRLSDFPEALRINVGGTLVIEDVAGTPGLSETDRNSIGALGFGALVAATLRRGEANPLWTVVAVSAASRRWTTNEVALAEEVAERTWAAMERASAEAALRESEERLRLATEHAEVGFWDVEESHGALTWPPRVKAMFGISADEPVSMEDFYAGLHPDDRPLVAAAYAAAADPRTRALYDVEYRTIGKEDGVTRWVAAKGRGVFDAEGKGARCLRVLGTAIDISARKAAEAALRESEARFRAVQDTSIDGFMVLDSIRDGSGRIVDFVWRHANAAAARIVGRPVEAFLGRRLLEEMPGNREEGLFDAYVRVVETGEPWTHEFDYKHEGVNVYIRLVAAKAGDGFAVSFADLSERRRAEQRVADSEARYRTLFTSIESGFCTVEVDLDGSRGGTPGRVDYRVVEANPAFYAQTGFPSAILGRWLRKAAPGLEEHWFETYAAVARTGDAVRFEQSSELLRRWFDVYAFRVGEPEEARVAILFSDITARRAAEMALQALNQDLEARVVERTAALTLYRNIVESDRFPVCAYDADMRVTAFNKAHADELYRILGHRQQVGDLFPDLFPPDQAPIVRAFTERALAGETFTIAGEFGDPDWEKPHWESDYAPVRDEKGRITGAFHHARDVTERLRAQAELEAAQEQLRQSQKMEAMGSLTGGVAHDFNNLLTPIIGSLDRLVRRGVGSERERQLMAGALESAERAKTLVQRLLAFARRQPLQPVAVDVRELVEGMAGLIGSTLGPTIEVRTEVDAGLPPAKADPNQLEMALLNLAVNARDAMPEGGRLTLAAMRESVRRPGRSGPSPGHYVRLAVTDTGVGMDAATRERAVEPFFSTKGIGRGTGLGLSMVHGLAAQLGGGLTIDSEPGRGTTVALWLPISAEPIQEADGEPVAPRLISASRGRALLVDDEDLVRMSTADMLAEMGFDVLEAGSAEDALQLLREGATIDLLVTDHLMPGLSGAELARKARRLRPDLPALIVSGYAEVDGIAPDLPRLVKPFRAAELAERVAALVPGTPQDG